MCLHQTYTYFCINHSINEEEFSIRVCCTFFFFFFLFFLNTQICVPQIKVGMSQVIYHFKNRAVIRTTLKNRFQVFDFLSFFEQEGVLCFSTKKKTQLFIGKVRVTYHIKTFSTLTPRMASKNFKRMTQC